MVSPWSGYVFLNGNDPWVDGDTPLYACVDELFFEKKDLMARNYEKEGRWQASEEQKTRRAQRNKARRQAIRAGLVKKGDNLELDHVGSNRRGTLGSKVKVVTKTANRKRQPKRNGKDD